MSTSGTTSSRLSTVALIGVALIIAAFPMFFHFGDPDSEELFSGTDAAAEGVVEVENPDYQPWFEPVIGELPGEVESGLFALQAGLGAGFVGYVLGHYRARTKLEEQLAARGGTTLD